MTTNDLHDLADELSSINYPTNIVQKIFDADLLNRLFEEVTIPKRHRASIPYMITIIGGYQWYITTVEKDKAG